MAVKRCIRCFREGAKEAHFELSATSLSFSAELCKGCTYEVRKSLDFLGWVFERIGGLQHGFPDTESGESENGVREPESQVGDGGQGHTNNATGSRKPKKAEAT